MDTFITNTTNELIQLMMLLQASVFVYILYLLIKFEKPRLLIALYSIVLALFIWLKFEFIEYELTSDYDKFLWWTYNLLYAYCFVYIVSHDKWEKRKEHLKNLKY